jgi:hypothetical protein
MSEYQYYEFQTIDRPLSKADQDALRGLSSRARITATSFTNSYEWGDFKGNPAALMDRWFDLHLYLANWGTHRLMMRLPARLIDRARLDAFLGEADCAELKMMGENLILDITVQEMESEDWDDDSDWLAALTPLRADVLSGDLRMFYLLWLTAVEADVYRPDQPEPLPGIGPMTAALEAFADFFGIARDLVAAAAERSADPFAGKPVATEASSSVIAAMTDREKTDLLVRLFGGDAHVGSELRALVRGHLTQDVQPVAARTVGQLLARAEAIRRDRERGEAEKVAAEQKRREEEAERSRRARLDAITRRGESAWREIETEIERRNASSYDKAAALLTDLRTIAEEKGTIEDFGRRLRVIHERHGRKERFIERLGGLG